MLQKNVARQSILDSQKNTKSLSKTEIALVSESSHVWPKRRTFYGKHEKEIGREEKRREEKGEVKLDDLREVIKLQTDPLYWNYKSHGERNEKAGASSHCLAFMF